MTVPYAAHIQRFLLKMSTWYSKHVEENIWRINNIKCITLVFCMVKYSEIGQKYLSMIFNNLAVLVFYCKLQLIQNILTNILYPPPAPRRSIKFWRQGKRINWKSCSLPKICCHFGPCIWWNYENIRIKMVQDFKIILQNFPFCYSHSICNSFWTF